MFLIPSAWQTTARPPSTSHLTVPVKSVEEVEPLQFKRRERFRVFIRDCNGISDRAFSSDGLGNPCAHAIATQDSTEISCRQFSGYVGGQVIAVSDPGVSFQDDGLRDEESGFSSPGLQSLVANSISFRSGVKARPTQGHRKRYEQNKYGIRPEARTISVPTWDYGCREDYRFLVSPSATPAKAFVRTVPVRGQLRS